MSSAIIEVPQSLTASVTPEQRAKKGRKSMARRSGQCGYLERKGNSWYVRFWMDVAGQEKRKRMSTRICPVKGPNALAKPERERRAKEVIAASGADTVQLFEKVQAFNQGATFRQQSAWWLNHSRTRKRNPIKPATAVGYQSYVDRWLDPNMGNLPLSRVDNKALKEFVEKLVMAKLAPKTIVEIVAVVKKVVASAVDDSGQKIYPREWNHEYIDLPTVKASKQHTPTVEAKEVSDIVSKADGRYKVLYALLAGTGLRIGEALGLEIGEPSDERSGISSDCKTIHVRKSIWRGKKQNPKTDNAVRDIDVPASLAAMLKDFIGNRTSGFVFQTKIGRPLTPRNILRDSLRKISDTATFHAFRRFRITNLREVGVPEDLVRFWVGHADKSVTDRYSKMKKRIPVRQEWSEKVGLGFDVGPNGPKTTASAAIANAA